jgi:integrase
MARPAKPWFRPSRGVWMVTFQGQQVNLGVTDPGPAGEAAALALFRRLMAGQTIAAPARPLGPLVASYMAGLSDLAPITVQVYRHHLAQLVAALGPDRDAATLTATDIEATAGRPGWSSSTRNGYLGAVGVFLTAVGIRLDRKLKRPPKESRGADAVWSEEEFWRMLGAVRGDVRGVLTVLWHTGARPAEVFTLTAESIDWIRGTATLKKHKNAKRGKPRVLHFPPAAMTVLKAQAAKYGNTGYLFRMGARTKTPDKPLTRAGLGRRVWIARKRAGIDRPLSAYGLRHSYITRALERGWAAEQVAGLVGNSAAIISRVYSHVGANHDLMRKIADSMSA